MLNGVGERREARFYIFAEMDAQRAAAAFGENGEIAAGLRSFYDAERVFLVGHRQIDGVIARDLQKNAAVGAALVGLARGVKEAFAASQPAA